MSDQNLDYVAVRRNVEKRVRQQKRLYQMIFFWTHLVVFVVSMLAVWGTVLADAQLRTVLFNTVQGGAIIVVLPTILWALIMLCHVALLFVESGAGEKRMRDQLLMQAVGEEMLRKGLAEQGIGEKPKRRAALDAERMMFVR